MKRVVLFLSTLAISCGFAQGNFKFVEENHDFGQIPEGPQVSYTFEYTNVGDKPLTVTNVAPSCGCTIPDWSKEPVQPGAKGFIKAIYNTQNRVGKFNKSMTITSDAVETTKQVYFSGEVMAAPDTSKKVDVAPVTNEPAKVEEVKKETPKTTPASNKKPASGKKTSVNASPKANNNKGTVKKAAATDKKNANKK